MSKQRLSRVTWALVLGGGRSAGTIACRPATSGKANVALKRVDGSTIERTLDGEDVGKETATWTLSADGKTLTVVAKGTMQTASRTPPRRCEKQ